MPGASARRSLHSYLVVGPRCQISRPCNEECRPSLRENRGEPSLEQREHEEDKAYGYVDLPAAYDFQEQVGGVHERCQTYELWKARCKYVPCGLPNE